VSANAYFVGGLDTGGVPAYTRLDTSITWRGMENLEFSVTGQNLLGGHKEFGDRVSTAVEIGRTAFGKVAWSF
jgi:hypothetical protein